MTSPARARLNREDWSRHVRSLLRFLSILFTGLSLGAGSILSQSAAPWLDSEVQKIMPKLTTTYEGIHEHPELGKQEVKTALLVREYLKTVGYTDFVPEPTLPTAVIALLDTKKPGKVVVLRSELDARPGNEKADVEYKSQEAGKMHSCGHDAHTAILLAAAEILMRHKDQLSGKFVFLFQPAEETPGGADDIVRDGILQKVQADMIFAQHVAPGLPVGTMQVAPGPIMASSTYFTVNVHGADSHAASPETGADVVRVAAELASAMSSFPARHLNVLDQPTIISITHFEAGQHSALNRIPGDAVFEGTLRSFSDAGSAEYKAMIAALDAHIGGLGKANSVTATIEWRTGSPVATNDAKLLRTIVPVLTRTWDGPLLTDNQRSMYSEDFAYYTSILPSLYFSLGISDGTRGMHGVHTDEFDISLDALPKGAKFLVTLALAAQVN